MYEKLPEYVVCQFPVVAGDTATLQGYHDAALIEKMHKYFPLLIAEIRRLRMEKEANRLMENKNDQRTT
jgi:hypothetical protein